MARRRSPLEREATSQGARRLREERETIRQLLKGWRRIEAAIAADATALTERINKRLEAGKPVNDSWLHRQDRYHRLLEQMDRRIAELADQAGRPLTDAQRQLLERVNDEARALTQASLAGLPQGQQVLTMSAWNQLDWAAAEAMIGRTTAGQPLADLLEQIAPDSVRRARQILEVGIANGTNPRVIARQLGKVSDEAASRLATIARTEMLGAQREATLSLYEANPQLLKGWAWHATLDDRTCLACVAMHGRRFTFKERERLDGHPNCRCQMVPITLTWEELGLGNFGLGETNPYAAGLVPTGPEWFDTLPLDQQLTIAGPTRLDLMSEGKIDWPDLVKQTDHPRWGTMRRKASIAEAEEAARKRRRRG